MTTSLIICKISDFTAMVHCPNIMPTFYPSLLPLTYHGNPLPVITRSQISKLLPAALCLFATQAFSQPRASWNFPGGNLLKAEQLSTSHFRLHLAGESDQDNRNRQANWYYFRIDNAPAAGITLDLVNIPGEYNYKPNRGAVTADTPPLISFDNKTWTHVTDFEYSPEEPRMRLRIAHAGTFWIAHVPPYTLAHLEDLRKWAKRQSIFSERVIGKSVQGRELLEWTIGSGPKTAWLFFRQHSWESGSSWAGEGLIRYLLSAEGQQDRAAVTWKIFPMCDPDGVERGGVRFNKFGFDLNRNWDVHDPSKMPEITAQRAAIKKWLDTGRSIDFLFSLHNTETSEYLEGPPQKGGEGRYTALAERLFTRLAEHTSFAHTRPLFYSESSTTEGKPGRMNVIQGLYKDFQVPGFIMEQRISMHPKYGRLPLIADRLQFGRELAQAITHALRPAK